MLAQPLVSVVIAAYNAGPFIVETIEMIVCLMTRSSGLSPNLGRMCHICQENTGGAGARNMGIAFVWATTLRFWTMMTCGFLRSSKSSYKLQCATGTVFSSTVGPARCDYGASNTRSRRIFRS